MNLQLRAGAYPPMARVMKRNDRRRRLAGDDADPDRQQEAVRSRERAAGSPSGRECCMPHGHHCENASRIRWSFENALDLMEKPLQHLLAAIEGAGRRVSARVLQENAHEKGHVEQQCITYCSHRKPHFCRHHLKTIVDIVVTTSIIFLLSYPNKSAKTTR